MRVGAAGTDEVKSGRGNAVIADAYAEGLASFVIAVQHNPKSGILRHIIERNRPGSSLQDYGINLQPTTVEIETPEMRLERLKRDGFITEYLACCFVEMQSEPIVVYVVGAARCPVPDVRVTEDLCRLRRFCRRLGQRLKRT